MALLRRGFAGLALLSLAACATAPEPRVKVERVEIPVVTPCAADPGPEPAYADTPAALAAGADILERVKLLLAGRAQRDARLAELGAAVTGCR